MSGFDPTKFVQNERERRSVATDVAAKGRGLLQSTGEKMAEDCAAWRAPARYVAGVATVAALADDKPFAKELNSMFLGPIPPLYMPKVWTQICEDARKFVDSGKCALAMEHDWQPIELFGYPSRPWELRRKLPDAMCGIVLMLQGRSVGHVDGSRIEFLQFLPGGGRDKSVNAYRAHHMTLRGACRLMWESFDLRNWPDNPPDNYE